MINNNNIALALILGSGIELNEGIFEDRKMILEDPKGIHKKQIYTCSFGGKTILVFKGRKHFYEGQTYEEITSNVKLAKSRNIKNIIITNAAGGLNENFAEGDLMLIDSHINFIDKLVYQKAEFPYSEFLAGRLKEICLQKNIKLHEGVYGCYPGPTYETKSEIKMQKRFMIDAAGMSTIPEVYAAKKARMNVAAISVITNLLKENSVIPASHESILSTAKIASEKLNTILSELISELN